MSEDFGLHAITWFLIGLCAVVLFGFVLSWL